MSIWGNILPMIAGYVANAAGNKAALWGKNLAEQPMVVKQTEIPVEKPIWQTGLKAIALGVNDGNWSRRDQRRFRKSLGWSKLEMRNWKALQLGLDPDVDYSRKDLKMFENAKLGNNPASEFYARLVLGVDALGNPMTVPTQSKQIPILELPEPEEEVVEEEALPGQQTPSYFKTPGEMYLEYTQQRFGQKPLPFMLLPSLNLTPITQTPTPQTPITYNFGNNMNTYWANQAQKVLSNLTPEELYKISGNDGEINYDDAIAWLQGIGAGNDGKFGENTINAMNVRYLNTAMLDYKNPGNKLTNPNYVLKKDYTYNPKNYQISWGN